MNKIIWIAIFVIILFVLTYDPKSGTLEKYILIDPQQKQKQIKENDKLSGGVNDYRSCENTRYQDIQFAELNPTCSMQNQTVVGGVIVAKK